MSQQSRKLIVALVVFVLAGGFLGWIYGRLETGLLIASLAALFWHVRKMLQFDQALRDNNFARFGFGEGLWSQFASRFSHARERGKVHKKSYRQLLKEVRKSTNAMPDGGIILNADNEIIHCNKAAQALAGFRRKKDRGIRVDNILRNPTFLKYIQSADYAESIEIPSPIVEQNWLWCRIVPYGADQKLLLIRDVTALRKLTRMRREFVANASHELRSPLTVISGYLDAIAEDPNLSEDWQKPLEQMKNQASRMNHIVSELLELSRLEGSGAATHDEFVDVAGLMAAAKKSVDGQPRRAAICMDIESQSKLRGKSTEIESVITNLLTNALRHTPSSGTIKLGWSVDADGGYLTVTDDGEGIAEEHLPRLTERFYRVDQGRARDDGGVGLGLAIVKHILHRHDATFDVQSELGVGSRFQCRFPLHRIVTRSAIPINDTQAIN